MNINGVEYIEADSKARTITAIVDSKLHIKHMKGGQVEITLDNEPSVKMTIEKGSTGIMTFRRLREITVQGDFYGTQ